MVALSVCTVATNVLPLAAVADFGAQNCQCTTKVDARYNVQLTTSPAIEPNACYRFGVLFRPLVCRSFLSSVETETLFAKLGFELGLVRLGNVCGCEGLASLTRPEIG